MSNSQTDRIISSKLIFSQDDINTFAEISGDNNPLHIDLELAAKSRFGRTICHGMLIYASITELLANELPRTASVSQSLSFLNPVFANEEVSLVAEIMAASPPAEGWQITTTITKLDGAVACQSCTQLKNIN